MAACHLLGHMPLGYGAVSVDHAAAKAALAPLAAQLGASVEEIAGSIIDISVSGMYAEVSALVSRFAIDPREFHLFAFGGAGAMLACFLAGELDMKGVVVPPTPGVVSAYGGLIADLKNDFIRTTYCEVTSETLPSLYPMLDTLEDEAHTWLEAQGYRGRGHIRLSADMRYLGQSFEIETPVKAAWLQEGDAAAVRAAFHREHERLYGHSDKHAGVQMVCLRLVISGDTPKPPLTPIATADVPAKPHLQAEGWFSGQRWTVDVYQRADLAAGHRFYGPAIVAQDDTTTVVPPCFEVLVDRFGNLVITKTEL
jgi:N-methylhydantoinase A